MCEFITKEERDNHIQRFHRRKKAKANLKISIGNLNGRTMLIDALADTGACRTMISLELSKELGLKLEESNVKLANVQGDKIEALGEAEVNLRICGKQFKDRVTVIEDSNDMLVGLPHLIHGRIIKKNWLEEKTYVNQASETEKICRCP